MPLPRRSSTAYLVASWLVVALLLAAIFWFSAQTGEHLDSGLGLVSALKAWLAQMGTTLFGHDVDVSPIGHFVEYLLLGMALANALSLHIDLPRATLAAFALASCYGITDEIHQIFVPMRSCDPADWVVDTLAALIGALVVRALVKRHEAR